MLATNAPSIEADPNAVSFTLLDDRVDPNGRWLQTFRLVIKPGGTLADASELVYGDLDHVNELFNALRQQHPELTNPATVPANLEADLALDPRRAFVPAEVTVDPKRGATIYRYFNGAQRIEYNQKLGGDHKGLSSIVELPADRPASAFTILEDNLPVEVPAGVRIAYYEFQATDDLKAVVREIYGTSSVTAIHHFLSLAQWDPNRWPPGKAERQQRLQIPTNIGYEDEQFTPLDVASGNPADGDILRQQVAERAKAGIYALRRQPYGTVYRVTATDFELSARRVATLLYGGGEDYLSIAAQAGFGTLYDLTQNPPQDVRLFGRTFDVFVEYEREQFAAKPAIVDQLSGMRTTLLLNGTLIAEWPTDSKRTGVLREITLPSGYRKMLFKPQTATALAGEILYSLVSFGRGSKNPALRAESEGRFIAQLLWDWGRSVPHQPGEALDGGRLITAPSVAGDKSEELLDMSVRPSYVTAGTEHLPWYGPWLDNPLQLGAVVVVGALLMLGSFTWLARRV